jgi:hypothetical protein
MAKYYTVQVNTNGDEFWYDGKDLHCEHGPAMRLANGILVWYNKGKVHNNKGPAFISGSIQDYYLDGIMVTPEQFISLTQSLDLDTLEPMEDL